ncbi:MAG: hypothetical protein GY778_07460 [bacterium]|nr:hypothetical protein [bacterium]
MTTRLTEDPVMQLGADQVAMTIHIGVWGRSRGTGRKSPNPFVSYEKDILAHAFQDGRRLASHAWSVRRGRLSFPDALEYETEGRVYRLTAKRTNVRVQVFPTCTEFQHGVTVYHLTLRPAEGEHFNEYDLIKLVKIYGGGQEPCRPVTRVRLGGGRKAGHPLLEVAADIFGQSEPWENALVTGTVELCKPDEVQGEVGSKLKGLLTEIGQNRTSAGYLLDDLFEEEKQQAKEQEKDRNVRPPGPGYLLKTFGGIVSGIFDFEAIDGSELVDVIEPTVIEAEGLLRIQKGTLFFYCDDDDRAFKAAEKDIGNSPYWIIPQAALLHNEMVIRRAEDLLHQARRANSSTRLESCYRQAGRLLRRALLSNEYPSTTEKLFFERGHGARGLDEKLAAARREMDEVGAMIEVERAARERLSSWLIAIIGVILAGTGTKDIVWAVCQSRGWAGWEWYVWLALLALIGLGLASAYIVRKRRSKPPELL